MDDDTKRFDEDQTLANFGDALEFDEVDEIELSVETEQLVACVKAARYAGV